MTGIQPLESGIPRITASYAHTPLAPPFTLVTGHEDGTIRFWRLGLEVNPPSPTTHAVFAKH
jgi:hypothetical protein